MNLKTLAFLVFLGLGLVSVAQAQIQHVEMRVEGMT